MSTITKQWLQQKIADMEARRDDPWLGLDEDDSNTLAALHIALASLEAEKEYKHHSVISEQLAHVLSSMDATDHQRAVISCAVDRLNNVSQLLQSSPSALLVPEMLDYQGAKELYNYLMTEEETNATVNGWNACRAAMLQGAENVESLHAVKAAPLLDSSAKGIELQHANFQSKDDGNSPVIPDGWVACSERMPEREVDVQVYCSDKKEQMVGYMERNERNGYFRFASLPKGGGVYCQPTHWMPLPAAPQQEAKNV